MAFRRKIDAQRRGQQEAHTARSKHSVQMITSFSGRDQGVDTRLASAGLTSHSPPSVYSNGKEDHAQSEEHRHLVDGTHHGGRWWTYSWVVVRMTGLPDVNELDDGIKGSWELSDWSCSCLVEVERRLKVDRG